MGLDCFLFFILLHRISFFSFSLSVITGGRWVCNILLKHHLPVQSLSCLFLYLLISCFLFILSCFLLPWRRERTGKKAWKFLFIVYCVLAKEKTQLIFFLIFVTMAEEGKKLWHGRLGDVEWKREDRFLCRVYNQSYIACFTDRLIYLEFFNFTISGSTCGIPCRLAV